MATGMLLSAGLGTIAGMIVRTNDHLGEAIPHRIARKGPYRQRRQKRLDRADGYVPGKTRGNGKYFVVNNREIWCHPDDLVKLKQAMRGE
jgi:hypothetical protein